jgi:hypothetical protein
MFQFPGLAPYGLCIHPQVTPSGCPVTPGFPIRRSPDHSLFDSSPRHIAACHVLHRLSTPRHPPCTLSSLTTLTRGCRTEMGEKHRPSADRIRRQAGSRHLRSPTLRGRLAVRGVLRNAIGIVARSTNFPSAQEAWSGLFRGRLSLRQTRVRFFNCQRAYIQVPPGGSRLRSIRAMQRTTSTAVVNRPPLIFCMRSPPVNCPGTPFRVTAHSEEV